MSEDAPLLRKRKRTASWSDSGDEEGGENEDLSGSSRITDDEQRLRRRVFELSLAKVRTAAPLTRSLRRREQPLLRSVLILNTLRTVDAADTYPDCDPTLLASSAPASLFRTQSVVDADVDDLHGSLLLSAVVSTPMLSNDDVAEHHRSTAVECPASEPRPADDASTSSILDDLFGSERTPILTFSSLFDMECSSIWPPSTSASALTTSSTLSSWSAMDVDFDLDVAVCDFDLLQPQTTTVAASAAPRTAGTCPADAAADGVGLAAGSLCTQRSQMFVDDPDRFTEILVGT